MCAQGFHFFDDISSYFPMFPSNQIIELKSIFENITSNIAMSPEDNRKNRLEKHAKCLGSRTRKISKCLDYDLIELLGMLKNKLFMEVNIKNYS